MENLRTQSLRAEAASTWATERRPRKRRSILVQLVPVVFAAVLIGAVAAGLWQAANPATGAAPTSFAGYQISQLVTGPDAVARMSRLHGKGVGVTDGYIGHYESGSNGVVAYVGDTISEQDAASLLKQMEDRIAAGNQYFIDLRPVSVDGKRVLWVRSGQESHYFWQQGSKVIWLAFDKDDRAGLAAAVKVFK